MLSTLNSAQTRPTVTSADGELARVFDAYAAAAAEYHRASQLPPGWCLTAAGVTKRVMASFGYPGVRVLGVQICFFNAAAAALFRQGVPANRWPKHAWSVGVEGTGATNGTGWDGHAVAYLPARRTGNHAWLVDVSASQFSRPDHGLDVSQELIVPVSSSFMQGVPETHSLPSGMVLSRHEPALTRQALEICRQTADGLDVVAAEVTNRMTARLDDSAGQTESNSPSWTAQRGLPGTP